MKTVYLVKVNSTYFTNIVLDYVQNEAISTFMTFKTQKAAKKFAESRCHKGKYQIVKFIKDE